MTRIALSMAMVGILGFLGCKPNSATSSQAKDDAADPNAALPTATANPDTETCAAPTDLSGQPTGSVDQPTDLSGGGFTLQDPAISGTPDPTDEGECFRIYESTRDTCGYEDPRNTWNRGACAGVIDGNRNSLAGILVGITGAVTDNLPAVLTGVRTAANGFIQAGCSITRCRECLATAVEQYMTCIAGVRARTATDGSLTCGRYVPEYTGRGLDNANYTEPAYINRTGVCPRNYPRCCNNDSYIQLNPRTAFCYSDARAAPLTCAP